LTRKAASGTKFDAPAPLRLWHLASLDAPTVAVVWALGFAWAASLRLPGWVPALLALTAWAVYIGDRLLDARAALRTSQLDRLRERHHFHHRHRKILSFLGLGAACAAAGTALRLMPAGAFERNSVLAAAALAYFSGVHSSRGFHKPVLPLPFLLPTKELLVGLLFTAACVLPAFSRAASRPESPLWPLGAAAAYFALLAWLNCHAIERWERAGLVRPGAQIHLPASMLALAGLFGAAALFAAQPRPAALVLTGAASALLLALLDRFRGRLTPLALRAVADLVLLTPLALLLR
jgi:hypothetical protein